MLNEKAKMELGKRQEKLKVTYYGDNDIIRYIITEKAIQKTFDIVKEYRLYCVLPTGEIAHMFKGDDPLELEQKWRKKYGL